MNVDLSIPRPLFPFYIVGEGVLLLNAFVDIDTLLPIAGGAAGIGIWIWRQIREEIRKQEKHDQYIKNHKKEENEKE